MNKIIYLLGGITFIIGSVRVYNFEIYEFKYYPSLNLGNYSLAISFILFVIGLYFIYLFFKYKEKKRKYTICPKCKESFNYSELENGKCKYCDDVDTVDVEEYYKNIGEGNIQVADNTNSDTKMLNRDTKNNTVDIYDIKSGAKLDGNIDTRVFTKDGQNKIKDDLVSSKTMLDAIEQIASTDKANLTDFFNETKKNVDVYEGMKKEIANNPKLAEQLSNPDLSPEEKQAMLQTVANTVKKALGYEVAKNDVKLVSTDKKGAEGKQFKGHYNHKKTYVNDKNNKNTKDLVSTIGHETQHNMDDQKKIYKAQDKDQNKYATNFGEDLSFYTGAALDIVDNKNLASTNSHNNGQVTTSPSIFNDNILRVNNKEFTNLDKQKGDDLVFFWGTQGSAGAGVSGAVATGNFINIKFEGGKLVHETGTYTNTEAGAGTPSIAGGAEVGVMFTSDVKNTFAGPYINHGASIKSGMGIDISNTMIDKNTNKSTTSLTINYAPIGTPNPEVHSRVGTTNAEVDNKKELFDFKPILNLFDSKKKNKE